MSVMSTINEMILSVHENGLMIVRPVSREDIRKNGEAFHSKALLSDELVEDVAHGKSLLYFIRKEDDPETPYAAFRWKGGKVMCFRGEAAVRDENVISIIKDCNYIIVSYLTAWKKRKEMEKVQEVQKDVENAIDKVKEEVMKEVEPKQEEVHEKVQEPAENASKTTSPETGEKAETTPAEPSVEATEDESSTEAAESAAEAAVNAVSVNASEDAAENSDDKSDEKPAKDVPEAAPEKATAEVDTKLEEAEGPTPAELARVPKTGKKPKKQKEEPLSEDAKAAMAAVPKPEKFVPPTDDAKAIELAEEKLGKDMMEVQAALKVAKEEKEKKEKEGKPSFTPRGGNEIPYHPFLDPATITYLLDKVKGDAGFARAVIHPVKTYKKCHDHVWKTARNNSSGMNGYGATDTEIFGWVDDYYLADPEKEQQAEYEKAVKAAKDAVLEKERKEKKKKDAAQKAAKTRAKTKAQKAAEAEKAVEQAVKEKAEKPVQTVSHTDFIQKPQPEAKPESEKVTEAAETVQKPAAAAVHHEPIHVEANVEKDQMSLFDFGIM